MAIEEADKDAPILPELKPFSYCLFGFYLFSDDDIRDEWIRRWKWVKYNPDASGQGAQFMGEDPFLNKFYPDWYTHRYLPEMRDYRAYLNRNPSCKLPEFWDWFLNVYSRDNRYP